MAIANLNETLLAYTLRKNDIELEMSMLQGQKSLALYAQNDQTSLKNARESEVREVYKALFDEDADLQNNYIEYTEIPNYIEEMNKITADWEIENERLVAWETQIDAQLNVDNTELTEINAWVQSYKSMLSSNIKEDFNYGLNS